MQRWVAVNWDDLKVFLAVVRGESLSAAGQALKMDPATVGRRIARLEEALSANLFVKSPQGYALTEAGVRLADHAGNAERAVIGAHTETAEAASGITGSIRIGAPDGVATYILPQVLAGISDQNPGLEVQIVALPRVFNLSRREADMAITISPPETGRLTVQKLADYRLHLAASNSYLAQHPAIRSTSDLGAHRMIYYIPDMIFDAELDYLGSVNSALRPALQSNSVTVQLNWGRMGAGVLVAHDFALPSFPGLRRILVDQVSIRRAFYLIRHADDQKAPRMNQFAELLVTRFRAEVQRLEALT